MSFIVICEDGQIRHGDDDGPHEFDTKPEAQQWAWWGHVCTAKHTIVPAPREVIL